VARPLDFPFSTRLDKGFRIAAHLTVSGSLCELSVRSTVGSDFLAHSFTGAPSRDPRRFPSAARITSRLVSIGVGRRTCNRHANPMARICAITVLGAASDMAKLFADYQTTLVALGVDSVGFGW
jgi:hypothetical protein